MTRPPATPLEVVQHLTKLTEELDGKTKAYRFAERDMVTKRHAADMTEARAYLRAQGPVEERKRKAAVEAEHEEEAALVAEALVRVLKRELSALDTRIDVGRTYGATVRAEFRTIGMTDGTAT